MGPNPQGGPSWRDDLEASPVEIPPIPDLKGAGLDDETLLQVDIGALSLGDLDDGGDRTPQVRQGVPFDGPLALAKLGPEKPAQAPVAVVVESKAETVASSSRPSSSLVSRRLAFTMSFYAQSASMPQSRLSLASASVLRAHLRPKTPGNRAARFGKVPARPVRNGPSGDHMRRGKGGKRRPSF